MPLRGKGAVVTGGGRGIGAAVARELAAAGAAVVVAARSRAQIEAVAAELSAAGRRAFAVACDVTDPAQVEALRDAAVERLGQVDVLVNNAGVAHSAPLKSIRLGEWERLFAVNVTGTMLCTQAFLPAMVERGWGRVVNVASVAGKMGAAYIAAYAAAKHAVVGFTRAVGVEVAARGVTVNAVCPGYVDTEMTVESVARIVGKTGISERQALEHVRRTSPQNRLMEAGEVAYLVACLCHPRAGGINAQALVLDGGGVQS
ncbi:MAG TPA: SDR family NAD(P)-dependent oxidoreductase [Thermoanaerobaculia bacterium]|nr:SDR family NAD(P)-dependent oxidoreductase [Thermoanaerobaculia bacterium]